MLSPEYLQECADALLPYCQELQNWITADMIRRIVARLGRKEALQLTTLDQWQAQVYEEAGGHLKGLQKEMADFLYTAEEEIATIFKAAGIESIRGDDAVFAEDGQQVETPKTAEDISPRMKQILSDMYSRSANEVRNFTRTTAVRSQQELITNLNNAYFKVMTGAQSYTAAVREAVDAVANHHTTVKYASGFQDRIETNVLRAVRTGVGQASGAMTIERMHEMGYEHVLVSAHLGARVNPDSPIADHAGWQGKVYRVNHDTASRLNIGTPGEDENPSLPAKKEPVNIELSERELAAIRRYMSSEAYRINEKLRHRWPLTTQERDTVSSMDSALDKLPQYEGIAFRSVSDFGIEDVSKFIAEHSPGDFMKMPSYLSASVDAAYDADMPIQYVIYARRAADLRQIRAAENEVVFRRDSLFRINRVDGNTNYMQEV